MHRSLVSASALVLSLTGLLLAPAAHAATAVIDDNAHDGSALAEITHFTVVNGDYNIRSTTRYATFDPTRASAFVDLQVAGTTPGRYAAGRKAGGATFIGRFRAGGTFDPIHCPGLRVSLTQSPTRVRVVIPESCVKSNGTIKAGGGSESRAGNDLDFTRMISAARG
jgi:hypothetical protein